MLMVIDKDVVGAIISGVCLVHCLAGPLLLLLGLTSLGHSHFEEQSIHFTFIAPILFFAAWSIPKGLKSHHQPIPAILTVVGFSLVMVALMMTEHDLIFSVVGSVLLVIAHLYNRKLLKTKENRFNES